MQLHKPYVRWAKSSCCNLLAVYVRLKLINIDWDMSKLWQTTNIRDVYSPPAHPYIAIFELVRPFDPRMMPWKFRYDISNGSGVVVLTDRQTDRQTDIQTDTTENKMAGMVKSVRVLGHIEHYCWWKSRRLERAIGVGAESTLGQNIFPENMCMKN